jgi:recombination protein RecT
VQVSTQNPMKNKLVKQDAPKEDSLTLLFKPYRGAIAAACTKHMSPERIISLARTCIKGNKDMANAEPLSVVAAVIKASQHGLEPGILNQAWIVPVNDRKAGKTYAEFWIGYHGYVELMYRSPKVVSVDAHEVYEGDIFEYEYGMHPKLKHIPSKAEPDPLKITHAYATVHLDNGGCIFRVLTRAQIDAVKKASRGADSPYSPWNKFYAEMCCKTAVRRVSKYAPLSAEVMKALNEDETVSTISPESAEIIDVPVSFEQANLT